MGRKLDPEALSAYRTIVRAQLDTLEEQLVPMLENGQELGKMPAFGQMDGSRSARQNYEAFHKTTWDNLQDLREAMHGMIKTLNESGDLSDESEEANVTDMDTMEDELGGAS